MKQRKVLLHPFASLLVRLFCTFALSLTALSGCGGSTPAVNAPLLTPLGNPSVDSISARCTQDLKEAGERLTTLLTASKSPDFSTAQALAAYNNIGILLDDAMATASLTSNVHPDESTRKAAETCEQQGSKFITDLSLNTDLYTLFSSLDTSGLDPLAARLVSKTLEDFKRAGVDKDEPTRARIRTLQEQIVETGQNFGRNIREDVRSVSLTPAQLAGLPEDYIAAHPPGPDGKVTVTTDYPDYIPFMRYAKDGEARRQLMHASLNRGYPKNIEVLQKLLTLRHELANILGFSTWADFITSDKMIGSAAAVSDFLEKVTALADVRAKRDLAMLIDAKKTVDPSATSIDGWEKGFYENLVTEQQLSFDSREVRNYFAYDRVKQGLLDLTAELFSLRYVRVQDVAVWHASVEVYDVFDSRDDRPLGRIYLDMHPREGKYNHAAQFTLRSGVEGVQLPEGVLVCNFPAPSGDNPGLMDHGEVSTFFHEFGHLMHHTLGGHQPWIRFSGVATEWDFVEAPSQLFEEWALDMGVLSRFALHHKTQAPIPAELVEKIRAADEFGQGIQTRAQMFYAAMSLTFHNQDPKDLDTTAKLIELQKKYSLIPYVPDTHMQTNFGHLDGYSAIYYTYMWSLVIAKDLVSAFKEKGFLDQAAAMRYRERILEPGGTKPAAELVSDFLGRPYTFESFRAWLEGQ
jgi:thimet oligopeptidase